jgi:hypothetical protein
MAEDFPWRLLPALVPAIRGLIRIFHGICYSNS